MGQLQQAAATRQQPGPQQAAPPPQAPPPGVGQLDTTTAEGQQNPNTVAQPQDAGGRVEAARANEGNSLGGEEQQATPEQQAEYDRAIDSLHQVLYEDEERSKSIAGMVVPQDKVGSVVKAALLIIKQLDEQIDLDESVVAEITMDTEDRIIEIAETAHDITFSEQELKAIAGATWEGVLQLFGMDEQSVKEMTAGMSPDEISKQEDDYKNMVAGNA